MTNTEDKPLEHIVTEALTMIADVLDKVADELTKIDRQLRIQNERIDALQRSVDEL